jgi:hypothetical protein
MNMPALQVFHQGQGSDGWLWMNSATEVDGRLAWAGDAQVPNTGMDASPGAVTFNGKLYVFHQGQGPSFGAEWLWVNVFDGTKWAGDTQVPNTGIVGTPGAVTFDGKLYVFHQGRGIAAGEGDGWLWMNSATEVDGGLAWAGDAQVPNTGLSATPRAIVWGNL